MGTLKEALDRLEEAKLLLSEAIRNDLGIEPLRIEKIAVKVSNQRECDFIAGHLKFKSVTGVQKEVLIYTDHSSLYDDGTIAWDFVGNQPNDYCVVDFDFFCAQKGLTPPKKIMVSEDGVDLYEGDEPCWVLRENDKWFIALEKNIVSAENKIMCSSYKMFSTKEAAEAWIKEQETKFTDVKLFRKGHYALVYKDQIEFNGDGINFIIKPSDIEEIANALTKLNGWR